MWVARSVMRVDKGTDRVQTAPFTACADGGMRRKFEKHNKIGQVTGESQEKTEIWHLFSLTQPMLSSNMFE